MSKPPENTPATDENSGSQALAEPVGALQTEVQAVLPVLLLSSVVGAIIGGIWLATAGKHRDTQIPFGQYLAIAGWIQFISGADLLGLYLNWATGS